MLVLSMVVVVDFKMVRDRAESEKSRELESFLQLNLLIEVGQKYIKKYYIFNDTLELLDEF